ncbi:hypothetical protein GCM10029992_50300 [Glycomyces albus]
MISTHAADPLLDHIERSEIPAVACGAVIGRETTIPYAAADDRDGARQATRYLVGQGRRKIAMITGPLDTPGGTLRLAGFTDILGRRAAKTLITAGDWTQTSGQAAMGHLLEAHPDLDAVFVASDLMAAGALAALHDAGRAVPDDVAVAGFDDSAIATATRPALTTIHQPLTEVAAATVGLLTALLDHQPVQPVILPTQLVERDSA